jgi:hypothetical protein
VTQPEPDELAAPPWPESPVTAEAQIRQLTEASVVAPGLVRIYPRDGAAVPSMENVE